MIFNSHKKTILLNLIASPFFLAIPLALVIILFLPNPSSKYKIEAKSKQVADKKESKIMFYDLDGDGSDERVVAFHNAVKGEASIKVLTNSGINYEAWNFFGHFQKNSTNFYCTDIDEDGYAEIFVFYYRADSAFMDIIKPYPDMEILVKEKFVTRVWQRDGKIDFTIGNYTLADLNTNGNNEIVFILTAGYSQQPRIIISYDFFNDTFLRSQSFGANFSQLQIIDINNDSIPEVFCGSSTPANIPESMGIQNHDYNSWFFGFNNKLELLFDPLKNTDYPSSVHICKFESDVGDKYVAAAFINNNKKIISLRFIKNDRSVFSSKEFVKLKMSKSNIISIMQNISLNDKNFILMGVEDNKYICINEKMEIIRKEVSNNAFSLRHIEDINNDGKKEFVFFSSDNEIVIYDHKLQHPTSYETNIAPHSINWFSSGVKHNKDDNEFYIKSDNYLYLLTYKTDKLYYLKYPIWLMTYFIVVLILWLAQRLQNIQAKRKQQIEETINSLQMKTIKSQMDPHFMFNVLNGLANNVAMGNTNEAHDQILRFSVLLRSLMKKTDRIDIGLGEEIEFVRSYLELEKFRFKDDFEFSMEISETVNLKNRIPRMLIQLLVENAIKHGLRNKEGVKKLFIKLSEEKGQGQIIVEDNGVGRKEAMKKTRDTGRGQKLIGEMIRLNKKMGGKKITVEYIDLYDENGKARGTRVEVEI